MMTNQLFKKVLDNPLFVQYRLPNLLKLRVVKANFVTTAHYVTTPAFCTNSHFVTKSLRIL